MKDLYLKDLLNLTDEEISNSKIALNMTTNGILAFQEWENSNVNKRNVDFSYWSHSSYKNNNKKRNFTEVGQQCFGFVRIPNDNNKWLLVTVGKIKKIPDKPAVCEYEEIEKYSGFLGRLIVGLHKGNTFSNYVFNLSKFINKIKVVEVLPHEYQKIIFDGYDNVQLSFNELHYILNGLKYHDYQNALAKIKGIYCLTDTQTGNLYIGSAYGEDGLVQRWADYIDTNHGGNKALIDLYNAKGHDYFKKYFRFTLLEYFGKRTDTKKILDREQYWKRAFDTLEHGLNCN